MADLLEKLKEHVLLCDGSMGVLIQSIDLDLEKDYLGKENCPEALLLTRPDVIRDIHCRYFDAGVDMVETNSFGGSPLTLAEFDLADQAFDLNKRAAEIANEAIGTYSDGRDRFVIGSIGPGTKLPSLGHIDFDTLADAYQIQASGLAAGGANGLLIETCQDPLQIKAAVAGCRAGLAEQNIDIPIFVQVTVETTGTMLVGTDIAAMTTIAASLGLPSLGMNCATGPQEMAPHISYLADNWPGLISIQPNAGLPEMIDGQTAYPLKPESLAEWHERFIDKYGVNVIGGCCGTTPPHIGACNDMLVRKGEAHRPAPVKRTVHAIPGAASLFGQVAYRQENAVFAIGERCNTNGSKKFRELVAAEDWDAAAGLGRDQEKAGSHALDVCVATVGRDENADMTGIVTRMRGSARTPLVFDSTETPVLETGLKLYGGKGIINSINLEDGEQTAIDRLKLAKKFGAGVIALTIDEDGMAKTAAKKMEIARRLYELSVNKEGLSAEDLIFDPLTFTVCTGNEDDRRLAIETLEAIETISKEMPDCQIALGLSNISFGLKPAARHVLNSVFLNECTNKGMTGAIVHISKIMPLHAIPEEEKQTALDLIYDRRKEGYDPLTHFLSLFENKTAADVAQKVEPATIEEKLQQRVVDGDRVGIDEDLAEAMKTHEPLAIINEILLGGMKTVGELFGSGQMQLPFVLQAAETMKAAVAYLEPFMEKSENESRGKMLIATVKGDVHDIGKNLVDIILSNNGYEVVNLGIKQPIEDILAAVDEHKPDVLGLSGLLVKSTQVMKENLEIMAERGYKLPVILGGAALNRRFVETDCQNAYRTGEVAYARDAFDALDMMENLAAGKPLSTKKAPKKVPAKATEVKAKSADDSPMPTSPAVPTAKADIPNIPFTGIRTIENVPLKSIRAFLNENALYKMHWGYKKEAATEEGRKEKLRPILEDLLIRAEEEKLIVPKGRYGYFPCASDGNDVILFEDDGQTEKGRFTFPRQRKNKGRCLSDFFRPVTDAERDVIGLQIVTIGAKASEQEKAYMAEDKYTDYLHLHGLSVEMAEAFAEYLHRKIREEMGIAGDDAETVQGLFKQGYRGSRYSFGYPACPNLEDQTQLLSLLGADQIGITLSENFQMHPEQSTSAIVVHHPEAKYFNV